MLSKILKKHLSLAMICALFATSIFGMPSPQYAAATSAGMKVVNISNTPTGADEVIEALLSQSAKTMRAEHDRTHANMPFIKNVKMSSAPAYGKYSFGKFTNGLAKSKTTGESILSFDDGVIMSTGTVDVAERTRNYAHNTTYPHTNGMNRNDADLGALIGKPANRMFDTTYIEFDIFCPKNSDNLMFEYALASEEYNEYLTYNDVFGIFVNGKNISTIPNTSEAISISNVNYVKNKQFYRNNKKDASIRCDNYGTDDKFLDLPSEYDGFTCTFTASGELNSESYNHIKIAIADNNDQQWDSSLFLKAGTLQFRSPQYGTIDLEDWDSDNKITVVRTDGADNSVSVDLRAKDINGNIIQLKDEKGNLNDYFTVVFNNGETTKTVVLPPVNDDALINGTLPVLINISNPQNGAKLGTKVEIEKSTVRPTAQFGNWIDESPDTPDKIEVTRSGSIEYNATLDMKITNNKGVVSVKSVNFAKNESIKLIPVNENTRFVELFNEKGVRLGYPRKLEKAFPGLPTSLKKITFTVQEDSEVTLNLLGVNVINPKFNYKITKRSTAGGSSFSFFGDGKNLVNGMNDLYYMERGTYDVEIYWLDKTQAETPEEIQNSISKTSFTVTIDPIGDRLDKKKFYKKIN